jgi:hypothetical protein
VSTATVASAANVAVAEQLADDAVRARVTCPRCPGQWSGLKVEHCPGGRRSPECHLTFSSTRVGDAHLVDIDADGWSRHLTRAQMLALRTGDGRRRYQVRVNAFGTEVISRADAPDGPWAAPERAADAGTAPT